MNKQNPKLNPNEQQQNHGKKKQQVLPRFPLLIEGNKETAEQELVSGLDFSKRFCVC